MRRRKRIVRRRTGGFGRLPWYRRLGLSFSPSLLGGAVLVGVLTGILVTFFINASESDELGSVDVAMPQLARAVVVEGIEPRETTVIEAPPVEVVIEEPDVAPEPEQELPAWRRFALASDVASGQPMIAVVIDDMGIDRRRSRLVVDLPAPLTVSYLAYARDLPAQTEAARAAGHELMVHIPMEPHSPDVDPGPDVLLRDLSEAELTARLEKALSQFSGYVGINNHMGSLFTEDESGMETVMTVLRAHGLLFLDSRTSGESVGFEVAQEFDVPSVPRDVFLDHEPTPEAVRAALADLEDVAKRNGFAVGIGHPKDVTLDALREWIPLARERGFILVPVSKVVSAQVGSG